MNKRFLIILSVVALIILAGALWAVHNQKSDEGSLSQGSAVLPGLSQQLADVIRIQITAAGAAAPFTLESTGSGWVVKERHNYPANFGAIRQLLDGLAAAKFYEAKTSQPENYAMLGVADITDAKSPGVLVDVFSKNQATPYRLIIGKLATTWDGSYARLPGQAQSWLLDRQIPVSGFVTAWLNNEVLAIQPERLYRVTYTTPNKETLVVARKEAQSKHFEVMNLPKGKQVRYDTVADGVPHDFNEVVLRDVLPATEHTFVPAQTYLVQLETFDGMVITIQTEKNSDRYFLSLQAHTDAALAKQLGFTDEALLAKAADDVAALQKRAQGWVYEVNEHVYVDFTKTMKDVLPEQTTSKAQPSEPAADEEHDHH